MNPDQWGHPPSRPVTLALTGSRNMLISYKTSVSPFGSLASEHLVRASCQSIFTLLYRKRKV